MFNLFVKVTITKIQKTHTALSGYTTRVDIGSSRCTAIQCCKKTIGRGENISAHNSAKRILTFPRNIRSTMLINKQINVVSIQSSEKCIKKL